MEEKKKKTVYGLSREQEKEASRLFGRHVSTPKALCVGLASLLCCLLPMLLGLRLWEKIPALVQTGLIGPGGADDSVPRAVLVFGVPGLFALLDLISNAQLWLHQKLEKLPPTPVRMTGRWGIAVLGTLLSPFWLLRASGSSVTALFYLPCLLALLLMLLGTHFFDCPRGAKLAFRFKRIAYREEAWRKTHRAAGAGWLLAGLLLLALQYGLGRIPPLSALPLLLLLLIPFAASVLFSKE